MKIDNELREEILKNSNLYTKYSVRNKDGDFTEVVDVDSVINYIKTNCYVYKTT